MTVPLLAVPDAALLDPERRVRMAWAVHGSSDISPWRGLSWFNSAPCDIHSEPDPLCARCGVILRRHQRVGAAWLYLAGKGLLADTVGSGKTAQVLAMLAMCKEHEELSPGNRCVIVCKASAVRQWAREARRCLPRVPVLAADGTASERLAGYMGTWEVAIVSDRTFAPARGQAQQRDGDVEYLREFPVGMLVYDDIDPMRNSSTATHWAVSRLAQQCTRVVGVHGTPLQKRLIELYSFLGPVGARAVFGTPTSFRHRYVTQGKRYIAVADRRDPTGRRKVRKTIWVDTGVQDHRLPEFRALVAPLVLRRTAADLDQGDLPDVVPHEVWLDLNPRQRQRYDELRTGVLRRLRDTGVEVTQTEAAVAFTRGAQICSGLAALDDGRDDSAKLDWVMRLLTGDLSEEKAVCFVYYRPNVTALSQRLDREGIGHVLMWSEETGGAERDRRVRRFTEDPACRVLVGTTTIEQSLNLQAARHLVACDTIMNPARMTQVVGRIKRSGPWSTVFFHHLLARDTQEDHYPEALNREQAMADSVWGETSEIFTGLSPRQMLQMIAA